MLCRHTPPPKAAPPVATPSSLFPARPFLILPTSQLIPTPGIAAQQLCSRYCHAVPRSRENVILDQELKKQITYSRNPKGQKASINRK
ncbi:hypothetical protein Bpfe_016123 [Biomphalaria pfeifferi]|uniref:Uncharacterized protein n=1 Tax=Biomphalaria pfeifferi TaxID=112525 RepID=A0AAD8BI32_BIOPF|nr:hypothetical protein Bpfe_016123 [Biomphalaria pfeifferi]